MKNLDQFILHGVFDIDSDEDSGAKEDAWTLSNDGNGTVMLDTKATQKTFGPKMVEYLTMLKNDVGVNKFNINCNVKFPTLTGNKVITLDDFDLTYRNMNVEGMVTFNNCNISCNGITTLTWKQAKDNLLTFNHTQIRALKCSYKYRSLLFGDRQSGMSGDYLQLFVPNSVFMSIRAQVNKGEYPKELEHFDYGTIHVMDPAKGMYDTQYGLIICNTQWKYTIKAQESRVSKIRRNSKNKDTKEIKRGSKKNYEGFILTK